MSFITKNQKYIRLLTVAIIIFAIAFPFVLFPQPVRAAPADCYWVGDGGNWSDALNHWAVVSGGAPGAGNLPDATSNVHFDANSFTVGGQTVTVDANAACLDMDWTGATNTPAFDVTSLKILTVSGSIEFIGAMTQGSGAGTIKTIGTGKTFTANGQDIKAILEIGGGSLTFQDAYVGSRTLRLSVGTLDTNGQNVSVSTFEMTGAGMKTLTLGASVVTCSGNWRYTGTNLTLNADTSTVIVTITCLFGGGGLIYNNVELNGTAHTVTGNNTFASLTIAGTATVTLGATTQTTGAWINAGTVAATTGTIIVTGTGVFTGNSQTYNNVELNGTAHTVSGDNTFASLTNAATSTATLTGTTQTVTSSISNAGIIVNGIINLTGTASIGGGGQNTGTVNLNGTAHTISDSNTFNTLTLPAGAAQTITFTDGTNQTITTPILSGSAGNIHTLQGSGVAGWDITSDGEEELEYLNVSDSTANPAFWYAGNSIDGGGNVNWRFGYRGMDENGGAFLIISLAPLLLVSLLIFVIVVVLARTEINIMTIVVAGIAIYIGVSFLSEIQAAITGLLAY